LIDAAPLIAAVELGYFADEGLHVTLERQIGWGNLRDKLTFGRLDAAHALVGMPLFSQLGRDWFAEPLVSVMNLGSGGNAITISRRLFDAGVHSSNTLAQFIRQDPRDQPVIFAHVFSCSMHHYLLREWLSAAGIMLDTDVRLQIFPPSQMTDNMAKGHLDGFCVGEPWNTLAERQGAGKIIAITTDIIPNHPEKSLVVSRKWFSRHSVFVPPLLRALLRACAFCDEELNHSRLVELLAQPKYIEAPAEVIAASLNLEKKFSVGQSARGIRPTDWRLRSFSQQTTFPSATHSVWLLRQMLRWGQLAHPVDEMAIAARCVDSSAYREAANSLGLACPDTDFPPQPMRSGLFDPLREFQSAQGQGDPNAVRIPTSA
jgi:nitrate/nitrite transport system substrate-binding protein